MTEQGGARWLRPGTTGIVVIVALVAIAGAWLVTTFSTNIVSAAQGTQERVARVFMSDEEEIEQAVRDYVEAYNYEGSDGAQWQQQVERTVVPEAYYASPVGEQFRKDAKTVTEGGNDGHTARIVLELERWKLDEATNERASGTFTFRHSWDWITDDEDPSRDQDSTELRLANTDEGWKVTAAEDTG